MKVGEIWIGKTHRYQRVEILEIDDNLKSVTWKSLKSGVVCGESEKSFKGYFQPETEIENE